MGSFHGPRGVNHCLLEVAVLEAPQLRYTQDNQTPVAEMTVQLDGLRPEDPPGQLKVVGWGNLAQDLQNRVQPGQRLVIEGRLRMVTLSRADGVKEKRAELTLSRLHPLAGAAGAVPPPRAAGQPAAPRRAGDRSAAPASTQGPPSPPVTAAASSAPSPPGEPLPTWNTAPLVPDLPEDDEIPF